MSQSMQVRGIVVISQAVLSSPTEQKLHRPTLDPLTYQSRQQMSPHTPQ